MPAPWLLSLIWLFVLGGLGLFFPFYSLYLSENAGLTGTQIGVVMAIPPLAGILAQPFWGQVADRTGSRTRVLALLAAGASAGYALLVLPRSFAGFALGTLGLALFSVALIPNLVSVSLALLRESGGHLFGLVRVWGTIGFAICVGSFPLLIDALRGAAKPETGPSEPLLWLIFPIGAALVAVGALLALALPRGGTGALRAARGDWRMLLRHAPFLRILAFTFLAFLCLQGPMVLFPILVRAQGGDLEALSRMWLLMLSTEIPLVALLGPSIVRLGLRGVIALGLLAGTVRWLVSGFSDDLGVVTWVQMLHGVTVWGVVLGIPMLVDRVVPERLRSTGQGLMAMIGISLGGVVSNLTAGWLVDHVGPSAPAQFGGAAVLTLLLVSPWLLPRVPARPQPQKEEPG
ncbi:MAG: MFS transporter [Proteobacteria bacterium]|nr:MFS transporter [Pseudomonadota bacterium]